MPKRLGTAVLKDTNYQKLKRKVKCYLYETGKYVTKSGLLIFGYFSGLTKIWLAEPTPSFAKRLSIKMLPICDYPLDFKIVLANFSFLMVPVKSIYQTPTVSNLRC